MIAFHPALPDKRPPKCLFMGAHSDDIEIGCGGAVLTLLEACPEAEILWVVFSASGERATEAQKSAEAFLNHAPNAKITLHEFRDGFFPSERTAIKESFEALKSDFEPEMIFTHFRDDRHQDHRLLHELTWNTWRNHAIFEYEIPKYDGDLAQPNTFVPLTEEVVARKIALLLEHFGTQRNKQWFDEETFRGLLRIRGLEANSPTRYAEAFHCRKWPLHFEA